MIEGEARFPGGTPLDPRIDHAKINNTAYGGTSRQLCSSKRRRQRFPRTVHRRPPAAHAAQDVGNAKEGTHHNALGKGNRSRPFCITEPSHGWTTDETRMTKARWAETG